MKGRGTAESSSPFIFFAHLFEKRCRHIANCHIRENLFLEHLFRKRRKHNAQCYICAKKSHAARQNFFLEHLFEKKVQKRFLRFSEKRKSSFSRTFSKKGADIMRIATFANLSFSRTFSKKGRKFFRTLFLKKNNPFHLRISSAAFFLFC